MSPRGAAEADHGRGARANAKLECTTMSPSASASTTLVASKSTQSLPFAPFAPTCPATASASTQRGGRRRVHFREDGPELDYAAEARGESSLVLQTFAPNRLAHVIDDPNAILQRALDRHKYRTIHHFSKRLVTTSSTDALVRELRSEKPPVLIISLTGTATSDGNSHDRRRFLELAQNCEPAVGFRSARTRNWQRAEQQLGIPEHAAVAAGHQNEDDAPPLVSLRGG